MEEKTPKRKIRKWLKITVGLILIIIGTICYSRFVATTGLITKEYLVIHKNIPNSFYGLKIAHISDIHYGQTTNDKDFQQLVSQVNETKPDIIVITGDLLDKDIIYTNEDLKFLEEQLTNLEASLGKYIIMGDHDNLQKDYHTIISNTDFVNLDDSYQVLYNGDNNPILIAGISTMTNDSATFSEKVSDAIKKIAEIESSYNILIMHEPDYIEEMDYSNFQLVLAGHSLNGQINLPIIGEFLLPTDAKKYYKNHYTLGGTEFYISSGVGTPKLKFRLFNRPSFNLYRIVNQ